MHHIGIDRTIILNDFKFSNPSFPPKILKIACEIVLLSMSSRTEPLQKE